MEKSHIGRAVVALAVGLSLPAVGISAAYAEPAIGSGSGSPTESVTDLGETGSSVGAEVLGTGSGIASDGVKLVLPVVGAGSSSLEVLGGLLDSGSKAVETLSASASPQD